MIRTALLVTVLFALPAGAQVVIEYSSGSTPATMYFHVNGFEDFPINTQEPDDWYAKTPLRTDSACVDDPTGSTSLAGNQYHDWYGFLTPARVAYGVDVDGRPLMHQQPGMAYAALLDTEAMATVTWFLESKTPDTAAGHFDSPVPEVVVRATVREGNEADPTVEGYLEGPVIAAGQSEPALLAGPATNGTHVTAFPNGETTVYGFTFPLTYEKDVVPATGFNVLVEAFIDNPLCGGDDGLMPDGVEVFSSEDHRPHLAWNITNPLLITKLHPQFIGDQLGAHATVNSPWGSYDVEGDVGYELPMSLTIAGPSEPSSVDLVALVNSAHRVAYGSPGAHLLPVEATWLWPYKAENATHGDYVVTLTISNDQRTAVATAEASICLPYGCVHEANPPPNCNGSAGAPQAMCPGTDPKQAPGPSGILALLLVAWAAETRRREA